MEERNKDIKILNYEDLNKREQLSFNVIDNILLSYSNKEKVRVFKVMLNKYGGKNDI